MNQSKKTSKKKETPNKQIKIKQLRITLWILTVFVAVAFIFAGIKFFNLFSRTSSYSDENEKQMHPDSFLNIGESLSNTKYLAYFAGKDLNPGKHEFEEFLKDYSLYAKAEKKADESFAAVINENYTDDSLIANQVLNVLLNEYLNPLREAVDEKHYANKDLQLLHEMYAGKLKCEYDAYCKLLDALESYDAGDITETNNLFADAELIHKKWHALIEFYAKKYNVKNTLTWVEKPYSLYKTGSGDKSNVNGGSAATDDLQKDVLQKHANDFSNEEKQKLGINP